MSDILLDTGCSRTLVHQELVPEGKLKEGDAVAIRCTHGDMVLYPLADISLEVNGRQITVEAAVSDTLPMSVLLGTDNPELAELLVVDRGDKAGEAFAVTTRAQKKKEERSADQKCMQEEACGVQPNPLGDDSSKWMGEMDEELFGKSNGKERKTRKEKREERYRREQLQVKVLQATDTTLKNVREAVKNCEAEKGIGFYTRDGLIYRRWILPGRNGEDMARATGASQKLP